MEGDGSAADCSQHTFAGRPAMETRRAREQCVCPSLFRKVWCASRLEEDPDVRRIYRRGFGVCETHYKRLPRLDLIGAVLPSRERHDATMPCSCALPRCQALTRSLSSAGPATYISVMCARAMPPSLVWPNPAKALRGPQSTAVSQAAHSCTGVTENNSGEPTAACVVACACFLRTLLAVCYGHTPSAARAR